MIRNQYSIAILMATRNGDAFLREQLDSLLQQTFTDWRLFVHDDGSEDTTCAILREYAGLHPDKIILLDYPSQGSACSNFMSLLERVESAYYMFCDQDDVWLPNKIERTMSGMDEAEKRAPDTPVIVHTDLCVVDEKLRTLCTSFWKYEQIYPEKFKTWEHYAKGNLVTGCTMLFNNLAKRCSHAPTEDTLMHDAWITLWVVAQDGIVISLPYASVLYRQHDNNTLGAQDASRLSLLYRIQHFCQLIHDNKQYFRQMNGIRNISLLHYIFIKIGR